MNAATDRRVHYELLPGRAGEPVRYSLEELAGFYGLPRPTRPLAPVEAEGDRRDLALEVHRRRQDEWEEERLRREAARAGVDPRLSDLGRQGHIALWRSRLRFLDRVPYYVAHTKSTKKLDSRTGTMITTAETLTLRLVDSKPSRRLLAKFGLLLNSNYEP